MIKLYHRKNEIAIDLSGIPNPASIEIYYTGKMYAESQLPNEWFLMSNENKIICVSLGSSVPELVLNYVGLINVRGARVVDRDLDKHYASIVLEDIDYWENINAEYDKNTQYWEGFFNVHQADKDIKYSSIVKNNLIAESDEFYFADGTPYQGEYHQHGDGQAMTGSKHSDDSELIYRKDAKNRMQNVRKNLTKKQLREKMVHYKPIIPSVRTSTKPEAQKAKEIKRQTNFSEKEVEISPARTKKTTTKTTTVKTKTTKGY